MTREAEVVLPHSIRRLLGSSDLLNQRRDELLRAWYEFVDFKKLMFVAILSQALVGGYFFPRWLSKGGSEEVGPPLSCFLIESGCSFLLGALASYVTPVPTARRVFLIWLTGCVTWGVTFFQWSLRTQPNDEADPFFAAIGSTASSLVGFVVPSLLLFALAYAAGRSSKRRGRPAR